MHFFKVIFFLVFAGLLSACSESMPEGDPNGKLTRDLRGLKAYPYVMVDKNTRMHWVQQAVTDYTNPINANEVPDDIKELDNFSQCQLKKSDLPDKNVKVEHVLVGHSNQKSHIYSFSNNTIEERAKKVLESKSYNALFKSAQIYADRFDVVDVIVTNTQKPTYLILSSQSKIIWNIQKAEGAKIAKVVMLSSGHAGIANLDKTTPVISLNGWTTKYCNIGIRRLPNKSWRYVQTAMETGLGSEHVEKDKAAHWKFSEWFYKNFGQEAEKDVIGLLRVSHVLTGPLPDMDKRIEYKRLKGATLYVTSNDYIMAASKKDFKKIIRDLVMKSAKSQQNTSMNQ